MDISTKSFKIVEPAMAFREFYIRITESKVGFSTVDISYSVLKMAFLTMVRQRTELAMVCSATSLKIINPAMALRAMGFSSSQLKMALKAGSSKTPQLKMALLTMDCQGSNMYLVYGRPNRKTSNNSMAYNKRFFTEFRLRRHIWVFYLVQSYRKCTRY
jgi:hypothetical protein